MSGASVIGLVAAAMLTVPGATSAEDAIAHARRLVASADFVSALVVLRAAERSATEPAGRAVLLRERGAIHEMRNQQLEALIAFTESAALAPAGRIEVAKARSTAIRLFVCARRLAFAGFDGADIRARWGGVDDWNTWRCPLQTDPAPPPVAEARLPPPPPPPVVAIAGSAPEPTDGSATLWWRVGFIGGGTAIAALGLGLDLGLSSSHDKQLEAVDFAGVSLMVTGALAILAGLIFDPFDPVATE